jgi:hypothetical protein
MLLRRFRCDISGLIAVQTALALPVLIGFGALAVDASIWSSNKNAAAGASDLASLAAAKASAAGNSVAQSKTEALAVSCLNGYCNSQGGVTVTVNNPPVSGSYTSSASAYEVIITSPQQLYFGGILGVAPTISGRSVAQGSNVKPSCLIALETSAASSINLSGSASITANNCKVATNSTNSKALTTSGGACVTALEVDVVGNYQNGSGCISAPTITTSAAATADPYASLPNPSISACSSSINVNGTSATYSQGTYCGINVAGGGTLTLNAGTYYIDSGNFSMSGGSSSINASAGVSIVLTSSHGAYGNVNISGGSDLSIVAPSSGPMAGIALYVDRRASKHNATLSGGGTMVITGAVYMPTQQVNWSGGSGSGSSCFQMVALTFNFSGSSSFGKGCSIPVAGLATGNPSIVE